MTEGRTPKVAGASTRDLLRQYGRILSDLRARGVIRSENSPVGDYAEFLAAKALGLTLVSNSSIGYDGTDANGVRYQVKGRRITRWNRSPQLGAIRGLAGPDPFDVLVAVMFDEEMAVTKAITMPISAVKAAARAQAHVNGWRLNLTQAVLARDDIEDVTALIQAAAESDDLDATAEGERA
jgi:hypothetical protein